MRGDQSKMKRTRDKMRKGEIEADSTSVCLLKKGAPEVFHLVSSIEKHRAISHTTFDYLEFVFWSHPKFWVELFCILLPKELRRVFLVKPGDSKQEFADFAAHEALARHHLRQCIPMKMRSVVEHLKDCPTMLDVIMSFLQAEARSLALRICEGFATLHAFEFRDTSPTETLRAFFFFDFFFHQLTDERISAEDMKAQLIKCLPAGTFEALVQTLESKTYLCPYHLLVSVNHCVLSAEKHQGDETIPLADVELPSCETERDECRHRMVGAKYEKGWPTADYLAVFMRCFDSDLFETGEFSVPSQYNARLPLPDGTHVENLCDLLSHKKAVGMDWRYIFEHMRRLEDSQPIPSGQAQHALPETTSTRLRDLKSTGRHTDTVSLAGAANAEYKARQKGGQKSPVGSIVDTESGQIAQTPSEELESLDSVSTVVMGMNGKVKTTDTSNEPPSESIVQCLEKDWSKEGLRRGCAVSDCAHPPPSPMELFPVMQNLTSAGKHFLEIGMGNVSCTNDINLLANVDDKVSCTISFDDAEQHFLSRGVGTMVLRKVLRGRTCKFPIYNVHYVPEIKRTRISLFHLAASDLFLKEDCSAVFSRKNQNQHIAEVHLSGGAMSFKIGLLRPVKLLASSQVNESAGACTRTREEALSLFVDWARVTHKGDVHCHEDYEDLDPSKLGSGDDLVSLLTIESQGTGVVRDVNVLFGFISKSCEIEMAGRTFHSQGYGYVVVVRPSENGSPDRFDRIPNVHYVPQLPCAFLQIPVCQSKESKNKEFDKTLLGDIEMVKLRVLRNNLDRTT